MLEILQNLSGTTHRLEKDSQTISTDKYKVINRKDGKVSTNRTSKEVPVINKNDMLRVPKANLMVFGKGNPIWDRNQLAMPYSYMSVHSNALQDFDDPKDYTLKTVPTTANTMDFDILNNQPNFIAMVNKRVMQSKMTDQKMKLYRNTHKVNGHMLTDDDVSKINPEALSKEIMRSINEQLAFNDEVGAEAQANGDGGMFDDSDLMTPTQASQQAMEAGMEDNPEVAQAQAEQDAKADAVDDKIYAQNQISRHDLLYDVSDDIKDVLGAAYVQLIDEFRQSGDYKVSSTGDLEIGGEIMIKGAQSIVESAQNEFGENNTQGLEDLMASNDDAADSSSVDAGANVEVQPAWLQYLSQLDSWDEILDGQYDATVARLWQDL